MNTRPPMRAFELALIVAALASAGLTAYGWFAAPRGTWAYASHLPFAGGTLVVLGALLFVVGRWRRLAPMPIALLAAAGFMSLTGQLAAVLAVLALAWSSTVLGRTVLRRIDGAGDVECALVGIAVYGTIVGLLAHWPVNYPGVYVLMLALPLLLWRREARECLLRASRWGSAERAPGLAALLLPLAIATLGLVYFLVALMPELGYDALAMHLLVPARVAWQHEWGFDVDRYVWAVMPQLVDWLYTIGYVLAGETGARLVNLGGILLLGRLVHDLVRWAGSSVHGAHAAALLYLSTPLTLTESSSLFVDSLWTCFVVGGAIALFRVVGQRHADVEGSKSGQLVVGGTLLGGALAAKAVTFMMLPVLAVVLAAGWQRWLQRRCAPGLALGALAFLTVGGLPYMRAWLLTGNPVFPFFNGVFRSPHYPLENFQPPAVFERGTTWDVLYRVTFESTTFLEARCGAAGFQWLLLVLPVAVACLIAWHRRGLLLLVVAAAFAWLTFRETAYLRYVFPTFALAAAAVGAVLGGALPAMRRGHQVLAVATAAAIALNLWCSGAGGSQCAIKLHALISPAHRAEYVAWREPLRAAVALLNSLDHATTPVAFFAQPLAGDLHADALFPNWYNWRFQGEVLAATTSDALGQLLAREGVRYLILSDTWRSDAARELVREVSQEVKAFGEQSVRVLDERFRFTTELLADPQLTGDAAWSVAPGARLENGVGATVTVEASVVQRVAVDSRRCHRVVARVRRADLDTAATARLQVNWLDAKGRLLHPDIRVVDCLLEARDHTMDVVAPANATAAVVFATGHTSVPVVFESLSFRR